MQIYLWAIKERYEEELKKYKEKTSRDDQGRVGKLIIKIMTKEKYEK